MQYSDGHRPWACDHHSTEENVFHTVDLFSLVFFFCFFDTLFMFIDIFNYAYVGLNAK